MGAGVHLLGSWFSVEARLNEKQLLRVTVRGILSPSYRQRCAAVLAAPPRIKG